MNELIAAGGTGDRPRIDFVGQRHQSFSSLKRDDSLSHVASLELRIAWITSYLMVLTVFSNANWNSQVQIAIC